MVSTQATAFFVVLILSGKSCRKSVAQFSGISWNDSQSLLIATVSPPVGVKCHFRSSDEVTEALPTEFTALSFPFVGQLFYQVILLLSLVEFVVLELLESF